ncbi:MAG: hypothetical protein FJZ38_19775 [Candidatus Rokubacteria bacterium]|nr:hypothetical protein [Candidatus Rokubacteria bacterium]
MSSGLNARQRRVAALCEDAIARIDAAIASWSPATLAENPQGLPPELLAEVRRELVRMREALDPRRYECGFGRPLVDSYDGDLVDFLLSVAYEYGRIRTTARLRGERHDVSGR